MAFSPELASRLAATLVVTISTSPDAKATQAVEIVPVEPTHILQVDTNTCPKGFIPIPDTGNLEVCWSENSRIMTASGLTPGEKIIIPETYCKESNCLPKIAYGNQNNPDFEGYDANGNLIFGGKDNLTILYLPEKGDDKAIKYGVRPQNRLGSALKDLCVITLVGLGTGTLLLRKLLSRKGGQDTQTIEVANQPIPDQNQAGPDQYSYLKEGLLSLLESQKRQAEKRKEVEVTKKDNLSPKKPTNIGELESKLSLLEVEIKGWEEVAQNNPALAGYANEKIKGHREELQQVRGLMQNSPMVNPTS